MARCYRESSGSYQNYGGKGISVCDEWHVFEGFYADMGLRPEDMTLDRIDNSKGYGPGNCRWATATEQSNNRGDFNVKVELDGVVVTAKEYAAAKCINENYARILINEKGMRL